jgi:hypothetical protein
MLQLSAAVGLTRFGLLLGLMSQPLDGDEMPEDVHKRQVANNISKMNFDLNLMWMNLFSLRNICSVTRSTLVQLLMNISSSMKLFLR